MTGLLRGCGGMMVGGEWRRIVMGEIRDGGMGDREIGW